MKRSQSVRRVLLGGLSAGALTACSPQRPPPITPQRYFANDDHVPGAGYYHAPFHGFYPQPFNYYDPQRRLYFYGGTWGPAPYQSIVNISTPTPEAARAAEALRTDIQRGGFGRTGSSHSSFSS